MVARAVCARCMKQLTGEWRKVEPIRTSNRMTTEPRSRSRSMPLSPSGDRIGIDMHGTVGIVDLSTELAMTAELFPGLRKYVA